MNSFTPAERLELFEHIRKIFRNGELRPAHLDYWLVKVALRKLWEKGVPLRNEFGHNKVLVALETMELAAEEIGCAAVSLWLLSFMHWLITWSAMLLYPSSAPRI